MYFTILHPTIVDSFQTSIECANANDVFIIRIKESVNSFFIGGVQYSIPNGGMTGSLSFAPTISFIRNSIDTFPVSIDLIYFYVCYRATNTVPATKTE